MSSGVREDLSLWKQFLASCTAEKKFKFLFPEEEPKHVISTDASGSIGYGAVMGDMWFSGKWDDDWWRSQNIALLELYPVYAALHSWITELSNSTIRVYTDNMALVSMLNSMYSKDRKINTLLKHCALLIMEHNVVVRAVHIRTEDNTIPDRLSRDLDCQDVLKAEQKYTLLHIHNPCTIKKLLR